jgi:cytochrome P450 family 135
VSLPPGPRRPSVVQTAEWVARPTALLRQCAARYGEPFTLRTAWTDAPMVLVSHPDDVRAIFTGDPAVLRAGGSGSLLEPFAGRHSILLLDGEEHLRQRKLMLPAFHGERMRAVRPLVQRLAREELAGWPPGAPVRTHERMQALTLEVILRVVFGSTEPKLRAAITDALALTRSAPRLIAMSLGAQRGFRRAIERVDRELYALIDRGQQHPDALLHELVAAGGSRAEVRDQLVTLLAAGHETTATGLAWAFERLARHPEVVERLGDGDAAYREAVAKEVLRARPILSVAPRKLAAPMTLGGHELPAGVHVAPCLYLTHRRVDVWGDPLVFRPERFLDGPVAPYAWIPFGGGVRRCLGAPFALMEIEVVLEQAARLGRLTAATERPERMRRRAVTLAPARGGRVRVKAARSGDRAGRIRAAR